MQIYAFEGNQRGGKGIGITAFALKLAVIWYEMRGKMPEIYANFHLLKYHRFHYFEEWKEIEGVRNAIILYDEIGGSQDARLHTSKSQIQFTNVFNQMGKMGNPFLYTCQRSFQVEKRIREQTDYVIKCAKDHKTKIMREWWYDTQAGRESPIPITNGIVGHPERIYPHYNTYEVVKSTQKFDYVGAR